MARQSKYPEEFRRQAEPLVLENRPSVRDVARELNLNHETYPNWVDKTAKERDGGSQDFESDERAGLA